jgi:lysozyme family protein
MTARNFDAALTHVFKVEGGYADHPLDPGGATNYGITRATLAQWRQKAVSKAEVKALTRDEAGSIYRAFYWDKVAGDSLPDGVDLALFDHAVHSGPQRAMRTLQEALGVTADGVFGPRTAAVLEAQNAQELVRAVVARRMAMLERLPTWKTFGKGWTKRVTSTQEAALALVTADQPAPQQAIQPSKSILASKTIWGAVIALGAQILLLRGYAVPAETQNALVEILMQTAGLGGAILALWGRLVASHQIRR